MTWATATLGEIVEPAGLVQTGPFGSQLHQSDYVEDGVPVIMPKDIADGRVDASTVARVSEETAMRLSRHQLPPRSIVLPRRGEITKRALIRDEQSGWLCGTGCLQIVVERTALVPEYLYYYMEQEQVVRWLEQHAVGTTMLNLSASIVSNLPIRYPPAETQARVADILSAYDDLIENNRRRMTLLEESARQLYREWFVRLRFPGHEHTRITNGVPAGWEKRTLGQCARFLSGGTPSKSRSDYWEGDIPWVSSGELTAMRIHRTTLNLSEEGAEEGSRVVPAETILAVVRGMSLAKEFRIGLAARSMAFNQDIKAIVASSDCDPLFLFHSLDARRDEIRDKTGEASHGTKKLDSAVLAETAVLTPPHLLQRLYREQARSIHDQWDNLEQQNSRLRAARDLLLPRLMSGEIAV